MNESAFQAAELLHELAPEGCEIGIVLGSGLGNFANKIQDAQQLLYEAIPGFPVSNVPGHNNRFIVGTISGKHVIAMQGRFHYYEGYTHESLTAGIRAMKLMGVKTILLTNAAGGVNLTFTPATLMLIRDHINFSGDNPLIGQNDAQFGVRFPDMSEVYDKALGDRTLASAAEDGIFLKEGVYMMFSGPSFETPAEIRMARTLGADAVGMSTVPEAIAAAHCGMKVIGISLVTNLGAGIIRQTLTHEEVQQTADMAAERFSRLIDCILSRVI